MRKAEFLATWFVHDENGWRMKRHAVVPFYRWLSSWAVSLRLPSDIGGDDDGFVLPELQIIDHSLQTESAVEGYLFPGFTGRGLAGRLAARRASLFDRIDCVRNLCAGSDQWVLWCGLNEEADGLKAALPEALNIRGQDSREAKSGAVRMFTDGSIRVLITKPRIMGFGLNLQNAHHMAFVGLSDSYEAYYQCIRRMWRFGQTQPVEAHIVVSEAEGAVVRNVRRKEHESKSFSRDLVLHMAEFEKTELFGWSNGKNGQATDGD